MELPLVNGTKVKVKSDLKVDTWYGDTMFQECMKNLIGTEAEITASMESRNGGSPYVYCLNRGYYFSPEMFEIIKEEEALKKFDFKKFDFKRIKLSEIVNTDKIFIQVVGEDEPVSRMRLYDGLDVEDPAKRYAERICYCVNEFNARIFDSCNQLDALEQENWALKEQIRYLKNKLKSIDK